MRKSPIFASLMIVGLLIFGACTKETIEKSSDAIVQENNVPDGTKRIVYSVSVVPANVCAGSRVAGLAGATVQCVQGSSKVSRTTDASGIAVFTNLGPGQVTVSVGAPEYVGMNFTALLTTSTGDSDKDQTEFGASLIALFKKNAQIRGAIKANWAETPGLPPANLPFTIPSTVPPPYPTLYAEYVFTPTQYLTLINGNPLIGNPTPPSPSGTVRAVSMDESGASAQLQSSGNFTIQNVISVPSGYGLSLNLKMVDYVKPSQTVGIQLRKYTMPPQLNLQLGPCSPSPFGVGDITLNATPGI